MSNTIGIDKIAFYTPDYYVDMVELAEARGIDPNKYTIGLQQDLMAVIPVWEDIVTMGANAAQQIIDDADRSLIDQVIFATESSFDYSKSAATYIHRLLDIQPQAASFEVKQACYAGTAGLMMAVNYVRLNPNRRALVITSDIARYGLESSGEPTQGAGAVAMIISNQPRILAIEEETFKYSTEHYDFWRPSHSPVALVDGHFSNELYMDSFVKVFQDAEEAMGRRLATISAFVFHLPYTKMAKKALDALSEAETQLDEKKRSSQIAHWQDQLPAAIEYGRRIGNTYTAALYISFISMLKENETLKAGDRIGLFSYGSGAVSELFFGELVEGYSGQLAETIGLEELANRQQISVAEYEQLFTERDQMDTTNASFDIPETYQGFYLREIDENRRYYDFK
ncbi:hydroxymethylglutaryl-CoA synthase [Aerococcaceae bacterium DSM 111020]|nr:hydroxymethylglutaryl-CoA synthase [Aerococcaceae bacterium DSM 111020]